MGALRAAELHSFGMRGVGRIFDAYRDGALTDGDEVALIHGPLETGYIRLSEPMVNIRATLQRAVREQIIDEAIAVRLTAAAKAQFYQSRSWPGLLGVIGEAKEAEKLSAWLKTGKMDQKREEGLELLKPIDAFLRSGDRPEPPNFHFEWTETWHNGPRRNEVPETEGRTAFEDEAISMSCGCEAITGNCVAMPCFDFWPATMAAQHPIGRLSLVSRRCLLSTRRI
jgi:hypothetical protein